MSETQDPLRRVLDQCEEVCEKYGRAVSEIGTRDLEPPNGISQEQFEQILILLHWARVVSQKEIEETTLASLKSGLKKLVQECREKFICWGNQMGVINWNGGHEGNHICTLLRSLHCQRGTSTPVLFTTAGELLNFDLEKAAGVRIQVKEQQILIDEKLAKQVLYNECPFPMFNAYVLDDHARSVFSSMQVNTNPVDPACVHVLRRTHLPDTTKTVYEAVESRRTYSKRAKVLRRIISEYTDELRCLRLSQLEALKKMYPPIPLQVELPHPIFDPPVEKCRQKLKNAADQYHAALHAVNDFGDFDDDLLFVARQELNRVECNIREGLWRILEN